MRRQRMLNPNLENSISSPLFYTNEQFEESPNTLDLAKIQIRRQPSQEVIQRIPTTKSTIDPPPLSAKKSGFMKVGDIIMLKFI